MTAVLVNCIFGFITAALVTMAIDALTRYDDSIAADVIHQLRQWRGVFIIKDFGVYADPVNLLGDGKNWGLIVEPADNLLRGVDRYNT